MFLRKLSEPQAKMFQALAKRLVLADWQLEPHEQAAIERVEAELGHPLSVEAKDMMSNDNLSALDTAQSRKIVVYELLVLAQADLKIDESERHVFNDLADELSIDTETMQTLEALSVEGYSLLVANNSTEAHRTKVWAVIEDSAS